MSRAPTAADDADELTAALELAEGTRLARRGHYARADLALSATRATPAGLDLRARMAAQQGRYDEAAGLWREAAGALATPDAFAAEQATVARLRSRRAGRSPRAVAAALALGVVVGSAGWVVSTLRSNDETVRQLRADALDALDRQAEDGRVADEALARQLDDLAAARSDDAGVPAPGAALDGLGERLGPIAGVQATRDGDGIHLRCTDAVFADGTALTPAGLRALADVAGALASDADRLLVVVAGHTDPVPVRPGSAFADNEELALARARAGADVLVAAGVPADAVTVRVTAVPTPYPATVPGGAIDARNRTVTLTVHERAVTTADR